MNTPSEKGQLRKKGGAIFPKHELKDVVAWTTKLVSKTFAGPQAQDIIFSGVFQSKGPNAEIKFSAVKQFGFIEGTKAGYFASAAAKALIAAPSEERTAHLRTAALKPKVFKGIFDAFHGDPVTIGRIRQRAMDMKVHPDAADACVEKYLSTMMFAGLVQKNGDTYRHLPASDLGQSADPQVSTDEKEDADVAETTEQPAGAKPEGSSAGTAASDGKVKTANGSTELPTGEAAPRAIFNVNVTLDSSLDTEKLERHLQLLKKYGAI